MPYLLRSGSLAKVGAHGASNLASTPAASSMLRQTKPGHHSARKFFEKEFATRQVTPASVSARTAKAS